MAKTVRLLNVGSIQNSSGNTVVMAHPNHADGHSASANEMMCGGKLTPSTIVPEVISFSSNSIALFGSYAHTGGSCCVSNGTSMLLTAGAGSTYNDYNKTFLLQWSSRTTSANFGDLWFGCETIRIGGGSDGDVALFTGGYTTPYAYKKIGFSAGSTSSDWGAQTGGMFNAHNQSFSSGTDLVTIPHYHSGTKAHWKKSFSSSSSDSSWGSHPSGSVLNMDHMIQGGSNESDLFYVKELRHIYSSAAVHKKSFSSNSGSLLSNRVGVSLTSTLTTGQAVAACSDGDNLYIKARPDVDQSTGQMPTSYGASYIKHSMNDSGSSSLMSTAVINTQGQDIYAYAGSGN